MENPFKNFIFLCRFLIAVSSVLCGSLTHADKLDLAKGLRWHIFQAGLSQVDNLALSPKGKLFATLELNHGKGKLISIYDGKVTVLLHGLNRPDGLVLSMGKLYITEEIKQGRVLLYNINSRKVETLVHLDNPEGIIVLPDGSLLITEDLPNGRLMRLSPARQLTRLMGGLSRPEGLRLGADGTVYIAETSSGRVLVYQDGKTSNFVDNLNQPDQLAIDKYGDLWIAEDTNPGRILRVRNGKTETMISGLASPQGMVFDSRGRLYVAEQGRNRILLISFPGHK